jgi:hypothetical protein
MHSAVAQSPFILNYIRFIESSSASSSAVTAVIDVEFNDIASAHEEGRLDCVRTLISNIKSVGSNNSSESEKHDERFPSHHEKELKKLCVHIYTQLYDFGVWFPQLKKAGLTYDAYVINLSIEETAVIAKATKKTIEFAWRSG